MNIVTSKFPLTNFSKFSLKSCFSCSQKCGKMLTLFDHIKDFSTDENFKCFTYKHVILNFQTKYLFENAIFLLNTKTAKWHFHVIVSYGTISQGQIR